MEDRIIGMAHALRSGRYPDAIAVFAAGSIVRGEGTAYSDLDLVVVYDKLPSAYRESFRFEGYPVEAFVHDPETLEYFFFEVDKPSGVPALPQMVVEGVEIPAPTEVSRALKQLAASLIAAGPPALDADTEQRWRYAVTDLLDDLRDARSHEELIGTGSRLYGQLADYYLRRQGRWSARGKAIPRTLRRADPDLCARYCRSFDNLFRLGQPHDVIQLAEELLQSGGGLLFEGYRSEAPPAWRRPQRVTPQADQPAITLDEALRLAQVYAGQLLGVSVCVDPRDVPLFDHAREHLFHVSDWSDSRLGGGRYLAVSKKDGVVRDAGRHGE